jgi:hypothetical protein
VDEANGRCVAVKVLTLTHGESQSQRDSQRRQFKHEESILRRFDRLRVEKKWSYPHIVRRIISFAILLFDLDLGVWLQKS